MDFIKSLAMCGNGAAIPQGYHWNNFVHGTAIFEQRFQQVDDAMYATREGRSCVMNLTANVIGSQPAMETPGCLRPII